MLERFERPLRMICLALAALLVVQLARLVLRGDPLAHLNIPALPALAPPTNSPAAGAGTNLSASPKTGNKDTNAAAMKNPGTNGTNAAASPRKSGTNDTNAATLQKSGTNETNTASAPHPGSGRSGPPGGQAAAMAGMMPGGRMGGGMATPELPPAIQARVDKITDSEILGPVMRPQPMALIGISDQEALIRAPDGQTGPVKVGGELGGIKLLRIGINRVLIEQDGEKKELSIFGGVGGASLMPKSNDASTNPASKIAQTNQLSKTNQILSSKQKETH